MYFEVGHVHDHRAVESDRESTRIYGQPALMHAVVKGAPGAEHSRKGGAGGGLLKQIAEQKDRIV